MPLEQLVCNSAKTWNKNHLHRQSLKILIDRLYLHFFWNFLFKVSIDSKVMEFGLISKINDAFIIRRDTVFDHWSSIIKKCAWYHLIHSAPSLLNSCYTVEALTNGHKLAKAQGCFKSSWKCILSCENFFP